MAEKRVTIRHTDGREYSIEPKAFTDPKLSPDKKSYADRGFEIVSYVDGSPYDGLKSLAEIEAAAAPKVQSVKPAAKPTEKPKAD